MIAHEVLGKFPCGLRRRAYVELQISTGDGEASRPATETRPAIRVITFRGAVRPIASLIHAGVALRRAVQEVDQRVDRSQRPHR